MTDVTEAFEAEDDVVLGQLSGMLFVGHPGIEIFVDQLAGSQAFEDFPAVGPADVAAKKQR